MIILPNKIPACGNVPHMQDGLDVQPFERRCKPMVGWIPEINLERGDTNNERKYNGTHSRYARHSPYLSLGWRDQASNEGTVPRVFQASIYAADSEGPLDARPPCPVYGAGKGDQMFEVTLIHVLQWWVILNMIFVAWLLWRKL